ncbi:hypothetical protein OF385_16040 [Glutamicibacter sp. JL.03c]|uniref:hypothetical protein n=1 Tax=Glutamicibacter sp. JL.03c TaxID=2984842 RepID=UPI0021F69D74|nr:hypothetical protein [Glutamicibacter sp. JL.03c]UYQ77501.1 hypothetical protein OF385_16040 [Glutamicibacter sp. JL.03c]
MPYTDRALTNSAQAADAHELPQSISLAILYAVFSTHSSSGLAGKFDVLSRLQAFRTQYPEAARDLRHLSQIPEFEIRRIFGFSRTNRTSKARIALKITENLLNIPHPQYEVAATNTYDESLKYAFKRVHGVGDATYLRFLEFSSNSEPRLGS